MPKCDKYSRDQLAEIYRTYAAYKGWSTHADTVDDKVDSWISSLIGPVGVAVDFHESNIDHLSDWGFDAGARMRGDSIQHAIITLVGTQYPNTDGTSRSDIALKCEPFEILGMEHERTNPYDRKAYRIFDLSFKRSLGYISKRDVTTILEYGKDGYVFTPMLISVEPLYQNSPEITPIEMEVKIVLFIFKLSAGNEKIDDYANRWEREFIAANNRPNWSEYRK